MTKFLAVSSPDDEVSLLLLLLLLLLQLKNCLLLLVALRGSADPLMNFLLDKTFRHQTLELFGCRQKTSGNRPTSSLRANQTQQEEGHVATATVDISQGGAL